MFSTSETMLDFLEVCLLLIGHRTHAEDCATSGEAASEEGV